MAARGLVVALVGVTAAAAVGWIMFAPTEIDESDVEAGTLAKVSAAPTDDLDCDGGLKAEVGAAQHCTLTRGGEKYSVRLRVTAVDGENVQWDSVVAGDPQSGRRVPVDELERHTLQILAKGPPGRFRPVRRSAVRHRRRGPAVHDGGRAAYQARRGESDLPGCGQRAVERHRPPVTCGYFFGVPRNR